MSYATLDIVGVSSVHGFMNTTENGATQATGALDGLLRQLRARLAACLYCDTGPYEGGWRLNVGTLYLTDDERRAIEDTATVHRIG